MCDHNQDVMTMMMKPTTVTRIEHTTVADAAYQRMRTWILRGELRPGSRITIRTLAEWLGTSTTPVREALKHLQAEGLIVSISRREFAVMKLSRDEVTEIFQIRLRLEMLANEWAVKNVDEKLVKHLEGIIREMEAPTVTPREWRELNRCFHSDFYALSKSEYLMDLIEAAWQRTEPYLAIYAVSVETFSEANRQHRLILEKIANRDLDGLQQEIKKHMNYTCEMVSAALS